MKSNIATVGAVLLLMVACARLVPTSAAQSEKAKKITARKSLTQTGTPHHKNQNRAAPPVLPPTYNLTEAPAGYTLRELEFFERYCFDEVNRQREAQNLAPFTFWQDLLPLARHYSRRLAEENFFSHTDPEGRTTANRARQAGIKFSVIGENLSQASGYLDPVPDVVQSWMRNPGHRANILTTEFEYATVGVWIKDKTFFFTEIFLAK